MKASGRLTDQNARWLLPAPLYHAASPVLIRAGGLWDGSGAPLVRLELMNVGLWTIRAVTLGVQPLGPEGEALGLELPVRWHGLSVNRDGLFGSRREIALPVETAECFRVRVLRVDYAEGSPWLCDEAFAPLPFFRTLEEAYGDPRAAEQFRVRYGPDCVYAPAEAGDLWQCSCGGVNRRAENSCRGCRRVRSALMGVSRETLLEESESRLRNEERLEQEEKHSARKGLKRLLLILGVALPLLILAIGLYMTVPAQLERQRGYEAAQRQLALGQYDEAAASFRALGDYKDSALLAEKRVPYLRALDLMHRAEENDAASLLLIGRSRSELDEETTPAMLLYGAAAELLRSLGDYEDSAALAEQCETNIWEAGESLRLEAYEQAEALLEEGRYSAARAAFLAMGGFADSEEQAVEAVYRKAMGLFALMERYDVRGVFAQISLEPGGTSRFSLSEEKALRLGSRCVADFRAACGEDLSDVTLSDTPAEGLLPYADCVKALLESLEGYGESAEALERIEEITDYTKEFTMLCEAGDLQGALSWLESYEGDFADREGWEETLRAYLPFCDRWSLYQGDATLLPLTVGVNETCSAFRARVLIRDGEAVLRLTAEDPGDCLVDLRAELGSTDFRREDEALYLAAISGADRFAYMKYGGSGKLLSSCEYRRSQ